jgi:hypothetical protein
MCHKELSLAQGPQEAADVAAANDRWALLRRLAGPATPTRRPSPSAGPSTPRHARAGPSSPAASPAAIAPAAAAAPAHGKATAAAFPTAAAVSLQLLALMNTEAKMGTCQQHSTPAHRVLRRSHCARRKRRPPLSPSNAARQPRSLYPCTRVYRHVSNKQHDMLPSI